MNWVFFSSKKFQILCQSIAANVANFIISFFTQLKTSVHSQCKIMLVFICQNWNVYYARSEEGKKTLRWSGCRCKIKNQKITNWNVQSVYYLFCSIESIARNGRITHHHLLAAINYIKISHISQLYSSAEWFSQLIHYRNYIACDKIKNKNKM
jgi:hypothetical protein